MTRFNGRKVVSAPELRNAVAATDPNTRAELEFYRDGERKSVTVTIGKLDPERAAVARGGGAEATEQLGIRVADLTPELARQLRVEPNEPGVFVTEVDRAGLAARAGIRPRDMIVSVGGTAINSIEDFRDAMRDHKPEEGIRLQVQRDGARRFIFLRSR